MPKNQVQFQKGQSLKAFNSTYGTEAKCSERLSKHDGRMAMNAPSADITTFTSLYIAIYTNVLIVVIKAL